jgi:serine protease
MHEEASWSRRSIIEALGLAGAAGLAGVTTATPGRKPGPKERELIVGLPRGVDVASKRAEIQAKLPAEATITHRNETLGYLAVEVPESAGVNALSTTMSTLEADSNVEYVEDNLTYETQLAPADPKFDEQYAPQQVHAPAAWENVIGSDDVTIAVVDTGAQYDHQDLQSRYASDPGRDVVDGDDDPYPDGDALHGTHVSGCASADTDNDVGVAGVSDSTLINARTIATNGKGSLSDVADGIQWAVDAGADIINLSLGAPQTRQTMKRAVEYAYEDNDVLMICAAGNDSTSPVSYPARYEECVAVSALNPDEELAKFSNYGSGVDVAAPGVNVLSTIPTDEYREFSGTSMASPVAAGVAALGLAADPDLTASELRARLESTAVDVGLPETEQGAGRVDAARIVADEDGTDDDSDDDNGDDGDDGSLTGYRITNENSGLVMGVEDNSTADGASLVQQRWQERESQQWEIQELQDGSYRIRNRNSGKVADVPYSWGVTGTTVHQWDWNGGHNQRWTLRELTDGSYAIRNASNGLYLTVDYSAETPGAELVLQEWYGSDAQRWSLTDLS